MMRSSLVALVAARLFQAPTPQQSAPAYALAASFSVPYADPVAYAEQAYAYPSAPVMAPAAPAVPSKSPVLSFAAGAALGATVAVLFSSGKKSSPKPKAAAKKPVAKKPVAKPAAKRPVAKAPVTRSRDPSFNKTEGKGGIFP